MLDVSSRAFFHALLVALLLSCPSLLATPPEAPAPPSHVGLESRVADLTAKLMAEAHAPGLVVVVVKDGRLLLAKGYGMADLDRAVPMTARTGLRAGSVSKPVAACAVLQLVEQGKLALDAPIDRYLPGLLPGDAFGPASSVAQLLTMTAGYTDDVLQVHVSADARCPSLGEFLESRPPTREIRPGTMAYSSWNLTLLGRAAEQVTGEPFPRLVASRIFGPLGMNRSTFEQPLPPGLASGLATGYSFEGGRFRIVPYDQVALSPAVALVTTGEDMGRFLAALTSAGSTKILREDGLRGLMARQAGVHPRLRGRSFGLAEAPFGPPGTLYHDGNGIGFGSRLVIVPNEGVGIFLSVNHRPLDRFLDPTPAFLMLRELSAKLLDELAPTEAVTPALMKPLPDPAARAARYAGQYQAAGASRHNLLKVSMLFDVAEVRPNPDGTLAIGAGRYVEVEPGVFQNQKHPQVLAAFDQEGSRRARYLSFGGTGTYERVAWYGRAGLQLGVAHAVCVLSLVVIISWATRRKGSVLAFSGALANLGFLVGFGVFIVFGDLMTLFRTIPLALRVVLFLPWMGAAIALALLARSWTRTREAKVGAWSRLMPAFASLASLLLLAQVLYWRCLPW